MQKIVVVQSSGLGNQMFIYGCGYALAKKYNLDMCQDLSKYFLRITSSKYQLYQYNLSFPSLRKLPFKKPARTKSEWKRQQFILKVINKLSYQKAFEIKFIKYQDIKLKGKKNVLLQGFWQNASYVSDYRNDLKKEFTLKEIRPQVKIMASYVSQNKLCGIHVRLGDYLRFFGGSLDWAYYTEAIERIKLQNPDVKFLVFSDDIETCKTKLCNIPNLTFIQSGFTGPEEMYIMSQCNELIIANSTFSWWGAFLSNATRVICPLTEMWDEGYYLKDWEKINAKMIPVSDEGLKHIVKN